MLTLNFPYEDRWDDRRQEFVEYKAQTVNMEHSLVSMAKWESKWRKPFLSKEPKTLEESYDYFKCMIVSPNVDVDMFLKRLSNADIKKINDYIEAPMTATWFNEKEGGVPKGRGPNEQVTAELVYYWMIALNIPFECQKWHLNRLLTLVRVCNIKNGDPKKMSKSKIMSQNKALNAARRAKLGTKG